MKQSLFTFSCFSHLSTQNSDYFAWIFLLLDIFLLTVVAWFLASL